MEELKQVIVVRADLKLPKGKLAAQVAHASVDCTLISERDIVSKWVSEGQKKVILKVDTKEDLLKLWQIAKNNKLKTSIIKDAGRTFLEPGTITCLGIGPDDYSKINKVTGNLKMV